MKKQQAFLRLVVGAALTLSSSVALAYPVDLQIRPISADDTCEAAIFEAELKIVNTSDGPISSSSVYPELAFYAGQDEIEAVYGSINAIIFDVNDRFVTWTGTTVERSPWTVDSGYERNRRANQIWRARFDPPRANPPNLIPPHGYLTVIVSFRRAGGVAPFDQNCDDFTKLEHGFSTEFEHNKFFHLLFTSTQQLTCEQLRPDENDPLSGLPFSAPFQNACPQ
jgi:hypothetical protein